ncbi:cytochrome C oxidase subunit IV family protein [Nocardia sp. NPDC003963]
MTGQRPDSVRVITIVWLALSATTVLSWWLAPGHSAAPVSPSTVVTVAAILLGALKTRLVLRYFLEVGTGPRWLRVSTDAWLIVVWGAVLGIYLW